MHVATARACRVLGALGALGALGVTWLARADPRATDLLPVLDAGPSPEPPPGGFAPDPPPIVTRHQWVVELRYGAGAIALGAMRRVELRAPAPTARKMGRFALELYVGRELLDRVRFDFPLLGADELGGGPRRWDSPPSFERSLSSLARVAFPHSDRATRVLLVDRASGRSWALPWPPSSPPDAGALDAGPRPPADAG